MEWLELLIAILGGVALLDIFAILALSWIWEKKYPEWMATKGTRGRKP